jgi:hypothetical protein
VALAFGSEQPDFSSCDLLRTLTLTTILFYLFSFKTPSVELLSNTAEMLLDG